MAHLKKKLRYATKKQKEANMHDLGVSLIISDPHSSASAKAAIFEMNHIANDESLKISDRARAINQIKKSVKRLRLWLFSAKPITFI